VCPTGTGQQEYPQELSRSDVHGAAAEEEEPSFYSKFIVNFLLKFKLQCQFSYSFT
jgi:hypothetical protein